MSNGVLIDFTKIFHIIKKRIGLVIVMIVLSGAIGGYFTFVKISQPSYQAKASIIVGSVPEGQNGENRYYEMVMSQNLLNNYIQIAKSTKVLDRTISKLNSNIKPVELQQSIVITPIEKSSIIDIKTQNADGKEAVRVTQAYVDSIIEESKEIYPAVNVKILNNPSYIQTSSGGRSIVNMINSLIIGFFISLIMVYILNYLEGDSKKNV